MATGMSPFFAFTPARDSYDDLADDTRGLRTDLDAFLEDPASALEATLHAMYYGRVVPLPRAMVVGRAWTPRVVQERVKVVVAWVKK